MHHNSSAKYLCNPGKKAKYLEDAQAQYYHIWTKIMVLSSSKTMEQPSGQSAGGFQLQSVPYNFKYVALILILYLKYHH